MRKIFWFIIFLSTLLLLYSSTLTPASAKKKIIRRTTSGSTTAVSKDRLVIKPKLRNDHRALIVNFSNMGAVSSFSYELIYEANGIPQGVAGTITPNGQTNTQRELLFGTCSKNVCRYHTGITNMKFVVTSTLTSGIRVRKTYKVKV